MPRKKYKKIYYFFSTNQNGRTITYKLNFIDSFRFMSGKSSGLVNTI